MHKPIVSNVLDLSEFTRLSSIIRCVGNEDSERFVYPCRCGGQFMITSLDMDSGTDVVGCNGCSLTVKVEFEFEEGEDETGG